MKTTAIAATAAVAALAGGAWYMQSQTAEPGFTPIPAAQAQEGGDSAEATQASDVEIQEMVLGDPEAAVQVTEYASFTCPHCANFHDTVWPQLKENYIDTGEIGFTYREVYFDRYGLWAGMIARCSGSTERYFGIADLLYDRQRDWAQGEPAAIADNLRRIGATAGLSQDEMEACLSDGATAEALYAAFEQNAEEDDINSTPSFIINGQKYSNMGYDEFSNILDGLIEDAEG